ncbi:hypothetical protein AN958_02267 [Leucoagaricus sp. SymC.cos]|nr:hypothetical protein AN958_02267 [Leucoagaricus sp. SymC.cos]
MNRRNSFTKKEDDHLCAYLAKVRPSQAGRLGTTVYQMLVENLDQWPWAESHSWQSWRARYKSNQEEFDLKILKIQKRARESTDKDYDDADDARTLPPSQRNVFTSDEDKLLMKYLARYNPHKKGRNGNDIYKMLVANKDRKWNWSSTHSWQSWRYRYVSKQEKFDTKIDAYIERHNIPVPETPKPMPRSVKRPRIDELDTQEVKLAELVSSTPSFRPPRDHTPEIIVKEEPAPEPVAKPAKVNGSRSTRTKVDHSESSDDEDEDDKDRGPPGSEDYGGEIFANDDVEEGGPPASESGQAEDLDEKGEDADASQADDHASVADQPTPRKVSNDITMSSPTVKQEEQTPKSPSSSPPSKPPPQKSRADPNRHSFLVASQSRRQDDDPFEDSQPPSPEQERILPGTKKRLPVLKEGPYGNLLNGKRTKKTVHGESPTEDSDTASVEKPAWPPRRSWTFRAQVVPRESNAEKEENVAERQTAEKRRREKGKAKAAEEDEPGKEQESDNAKEPSPVLPEEVLGPMKARAPRPRPPVEGQNASEAGPSRLKALKRSKTDIFAPSPPSTEAIMPKRHSTGSAVRSPNLKPTSTASTITRPTGPRTINLRQELASRHLNLSQNQHFPPSIHRPSSRTSHTSLPRESSFLSVSISEEDSSFLQELGIQMAVQMYSKEFGFTEDVVQKLWNDLKSLRLLKNALMEMKESAERTMSEWVEGASLVLVDKKSASRSPGSVVSNMKGVEGPVVDTSGGRPRARVSGVSSSNRPTIEPPNILGTSTRKRRRRSSAEVENRSLEIRPLNLQEASQAMEMEYEPMTGTRAGKYSRLAKMGREDEALKREQRRVSSVAYSPRRNEQLLQLQQRQLQKQEQDTEEGMGGFENAEGEGGEGGEDEEDVEMIEIQDADADEAEAEGVHVSKGLVKGRSRRADVEDDGQDMDVDSLPQLLQATRRSRENQHESKVEDQDSHDREQRQTNQQRRHTETEPPSSDEEIISIKPIYSELEELARPAPPPPKSEAERWQEVEHLFFAANRKNLEELRKLEKGFSPRLLMKWIGNEVALL